MNGEDLDHVCDTYRLVYVYRYIVVLASYVAKSARYQNVCAEDGKFICSVIYVCLCFLIYCALCPLKVEAQLDIR